MRRIIVPAALVVLGLLAALALLLPRLPREPEFIGTEHAPASVRVVTLTDALVQPWALAFLPDGDILVSERRGQLRLVHDGELSPVPIGGIPAVDTRQQDGLMDIALHPRFAENQSVYFTYSKPMRGGDTPVLAAARFDGARLTGERDLFIADAWDDYGGNTGSRIAFGPDGTVYMTVGDRHQQTPAQDLGTDKGKILRLNDDGSIPRDNPFVDRAGARPEIFAYGVRNPQGLFIEASTGTIWEAEHGPRGGDELNVVVRGHNYGWPVITFGINYDGTTISNETARDGMEQPIVQWTPVISPSGLTIYAGDRLPGWRGSVFLGALSGEHLRRIEIQDGRVTHQEILLGRLHQRIRDVREGPDGLLYVLTDAGGLLRLEPAR
jgi:aldose sugar dehydrogenase